MCDSLAGIRKLIISSLFSGKYKTLAMSLPSSLFIKQKKDPNKLRQWLSLQFSEEYKKQVERAVHPPLVYEIVAWVNSDYDIAYSYIEIKTIEKVCSNI